jgi:hypothetical protein
MCRRPRLEVFTEFVCTAELEVFDLQDVILLPAPNHRSAFPNRASSPIHRNSAVPVRSAVESPVN